MKAIAITLKGIEDIAAQEIQEIIKAKTAVHERTVLFSSTIPELAKLCYKAQSITRVALLLGSFPATNRKVVLANLKAIIPKTKLDIWMKKPLAVRCFKTSEDFHRQDIEEQTGAFLKKKYPKLVVDLEHPSVLFLVYLIGDTGYFTIDFSGELGKRDYKVFLNPSALTGPMAYALLRMVGYESKKVLVDPLVKSGEVVIEAACSALPKSVHYFKKDKFSFKKLPLKIPHGLLDKLDKEKAKLKIFGYDSAMMNIKAAEKNAKIAGVHKYLKMSRVELSWLELKHNENTVDCIVARLPDLGKNADHSQIAKLYNELFYQAGYILKKNGKVAVAFRQNEMVKEKAAKHGFKILHERSVWQGQEEIKVMVFAHG